MGEAQNGPFQLSFNASLKVDFQGSQVTSDGGLILVRELDERLGLGELIAQHLTDSRGKNTQLPLADLLRQSIYSRMAGYEDGGGFCWRWRLRTVKTRLTLAFRGGQAYVVAGPESVMEIPVYTNSPRGRLSSFARGFRLYYVEPVFRLYIEGEKP